MTLLWHHFVSRRVCVMSVLLWQESKEKCCESICRTMLGKDTNWKTGKTKIFLKVPSYILMQPVVVCMCDVWVGELDLLQQRHLGEFSPSGNYKSKSWRHVKQTNMKRYSTSSVGLFDENMFPVYMCERGIRIKAPKIVLRCDRVSWNREQRSDGATTERERKRGTLDCAGQRSEIRGQGHFNLKSCDHSISRKHWEILFRFAQKRAALYLHKHNLGL